MLTTRELPPADYGRLVGTTLESVIASLNPACTRVLVVEDAAGSIVGCWAAILCVHAEGVWVDPAYRKRTAVQRRLWTAMRDVVKHWGATKFVTGALDPAVAALLARRAATLPPHFVVEVS